MNESQFYQKVKAGLKPFGFVFQRLETSTQSGVFDSILMHPKTMAWVEFKVKRKPSDNILRPSQEAWRLGVCPVCPNVLIFRLEGSHFSVYTAQNYALLFQYELKRGVWGQANTSLLQSLTLWGMTP